MHACPARTMSKRLVAAKTERGRTLRRASLFAVARRWLEPSDLAGDIKSVVGLMLTSFMSTTLDVPLCCPTEFVGRRKRRRRDTGPTQVPEPFSPDGWNPLISLAFHGVRGPVLTEYTVSSGNVGCSNCLFAVPLSGMVASSENHE